MYAERKTHSASLTSIALQRLDYHTYGGVVFDASSYVCLLTICVCLAANKESEELSECVAQGWGGGGKVE